MPPPYPNAYPVPPPPALPKHLFHFIIRYEGEGIIDQNVVKFAKALTGEKKSEATRSEIVPAPPPSTPIVQSGNSGITPMGSPLVPSPEMSSAGSPNVPRLPPANVAPQVGEPSPPPPPPLPF
jgi:hypothetical protein